MFFPFLDPVVAQFHGPVFDPSPLLLVPAGEEAGTADAPDADPESADEPVVAEEKETGDES